MSEPTVPSVAAPDVPDGSYLLDVREPHEWSAGHAPGATHLPLGELPARLAELPSDTEIVCVCRGGGRSARAAGLLAASGYPVRNLDGGMAAWEQAGRPMVSEDGGPPRVV